MFNFLRISLEYFLDELLEETLEEFLHAFLKKSLMNFWTNSCLKFCTNPVEIPGRILVRNPEEILSKEDKEYLDECEENSW